MKKRAFAVLLVLGGIILAACGAGTPGLLAMTIHMSEFMYTPLAIQAKVGQQVTLTIVNDGALEHEIMFGRNMMESNGQPNGFETDMFMMANMQPTVTFGEGMSEGTDMGQGEMGMTSTNQHGGLMVRLPGGGGQSATMTFTVTADMVGQWEFGCFAQDGLHYTQGMHGTFTVSE